MIYLTGDTHGQFRRLEIFNKQNPGLTENDLMIILGDAGFNYFGDERDTIKKKWVAELPFQILCIHGNHEMRPLSARAYEEYQWNGGIVYRQRMYSNILFAKDGEVFDLGGRKAIAIGGAYSVDKQYRLTFGYHWFEDEQPSPQIKKAVDSRLAQENWQIDAVLSHTCPARYMPTEVFLEGIDQSAVDNSTEEWLGKLEKKLDYKQWFCGHYHTQKTVDRLQFLYEDIIEWV